MEEGYAMRILKFIVKNNIITKDPKSDFANIVPNTNEELIADFTFSSEWDGAVKVAAFYNAKGECPPQELVDGMYCRIPQEALSRHWFRVQIIGNKKGRPLVTNKLDIVQKGDK